MKQRKPRKKKAAEGPSILDLLDRVEAEMQRLRAENEQLKPKPEVLKAKRVSRTPALGKGLSQLFGAPKKS